MTETIWRVLIEDTHGRGSYRPPMRALRHVRSMPVEEPWSERMHQQYIARKCNGIAIYGGDSSCHYLTDLPGLERVVLDFRGMKDDSGIFEAIGLKVIEIYNGGRGNLLPVNKLSQLVELRCDEARTYTDSIDSLPQLTTLTLDLPFDVTDLSWIGHLPRVEEFSLSGKRQHIDFGDLLDRLPSLRSLELYDIALEDLAWLRSDRLEQLSLDCIPEGGNGIDLTPAADLHTLKRLRCRHVKSLSPLKRLSLGYLEVGHVDDGHGGLQGDVDEVADSNGVPDSASGGGVHVVVDDGEGEFTVYLDTGGDVPGNAGIEASGYAGTGYFWQSLVRYLVRNRAPDLDAYEPDSEHDTMCLTTGSHAVAEALRDLIAPYVTEPDLVAALISEATTSGFPLDTD